MRYQVIVANNKTNLVNMVNAELRNGWKVTGGLAVYFIPSKEMLGPPEPIFMQAIIFEDRTNV